MLKTQVLNVIIIFSILGLAALGARDFFFPIPSQFADSKTVSLSPTPSSVPTPLPKDAKVPCDHPYFANTVGAKWTYQLSATVAAGGQRKAVNTTLTNTIVGKDDSSLTIESVLGKDASSSSRLICKESGVYGFPFPLIPTDVTEFLTSKTSMLSQLGIGAPKLSIDQSIRLLPSANDTKIGSTWSNRLGIDLDLPISINAFSFNLVNTISEEKKVSVRGFGEVPSLVVNSTSDSTDLVPGATPITYTVAENVGLTNLAIEIQKEGVGSLQATLKLTNFSVPTPSPTSSSQ